MILLNLKEIFESFDVFERSYILTPEEVGFPADLGEIREPVEVFVRITKDRDGYKVNLSIVGGVELECSRCLSPFRKELSQEVEKHLESYPTGGSLYLSPQDLEVSFMEEPGVVDLSELVREEIILSVPMKPLCRPDCLGLHQAPPLMEEKDRPTDPRFAILRNLLPR